jgi:ATP-dependent helicase Lhr and Lhr-like helicase
VGDRVLDTMLVQLRDRGLAVARDGVALLVGQISAELLKSHIRALAAQGPTDAAELAAVVANKASEKHHVFLTEDLLGRDYASANLDPDGAWHAWVTLAGMQT